MDIGDVVKSAALGMPALVFGGKPGYRAGDEHLSFNQIEAPETITVSSPEFGDGGPMPTKYSADGQNISPPLQWKGVPAEARSLVLMVEDPDAPTPNPFVHWIAYNLSAHVSALPEGSGDADSPGKPSAMMQGKNSTLHLGFTGAAPPKGDSPHHYHFQLYALDQILPLEDGTGRSAVMEAMQGHVLAKGRLIGVYQR